MEYYAYKPNRRWCVVEFIKVSVMCLAIAWTFYDRFWLGPFMFPLGIIIWKKDEKIYKDNIREIIRREFKEFITLLSGSLNAGYSLEQAIRKSHQDMTIDKSFKYIHKEVGLVINGLNLNKDVEELILHMGERCQEYSVMEFAKLVTVAKKYGGNINHLIHKTQSKLNDKFVVDKEIDTIVSAKRMEGNIMLLMPFFIMVYMRLTNGEYIGQMYNSTMGGVVLTVALVLIALCGMVIDRITKIEVL